MSQFKGGNKVRCVDCTCLVRLNGNTCGVKGASVSINKRRVCNKYNFKGEYENSAPLPATRVPFVDKKTRKLLKKLQKLGVMSGTPDSYPATPPSAAFHSTATADIPVVGETQSAPTSVPDPADDPIIWTPETDDE